MLRPMTIKSLVGGLKKRSLPQFGYATIAVKSARPRTVRIIFLCRQQEPECNIIEMASLDCGLVLEVPRGVMGP